MELGRDLLEGVKKDGVEEKWRKRENYKQGVKKREYEEKKLRIVPPLRPHHSSHSAPHPSPCAGGIQNFFFKSELYNCNFTLN